MPLTFRNTFSGSLLPQNRLLSRHLSPELSDPGLLLSILSTFCPFMTSLPVCMLPPKIPFSRPCVVRPQPSNEIQFNCHWWMPSLCFPEAIKIPLHCPKNLPSVPLYGIDHFLLIFVIIYTDVFCAIMRTWSMLGSCLQLLPVVPDIEYSANKHIYIYQIQKGSGEGRQGVKTFTFTIFSEHITWYKNQCQIYSKIGGASTSIIEYLSSQERAVISSMGIKTHYQLSDLGQDPSWPSQIPFSHLYNVEITSYDPSGMVLGESIEVIIHTQPLAQGLASVRGNCLVMAVPVVTVSCILLLEITSPSSAPSQRAACGPG